MQSQMFLLLLGITEPPRGNEPRIDPAWATTACGIRKERAAQARNLVGSEPFSAPARITPARDLNPQNNFAHSRVLIARYLRTSKRLLRPSVQRIAGLGAASGLAAAKGASAAMSASSLLRIIHSDS